MALGVGIARMGIGHDGLGGGVFLTYGHLAANGINRELIPEAADAVLTEVGGEEIGIG